MPDAKPISGRQKRFAEEYCVDQNGTQAAIRAGYSEKTAAQHASRLLTNVNIRAAVDKLRWEMSEASKLDRIYVLEGFKENYERAMQAVKVTTRDGKPTGEWIYDGHVANKALENIGKIIGIYTEKVEIAGGGGGPVKIVVEYAEE
jgi:phage terminase small subunit